MTTTTTTNTNTASKNANISARILYLISQGMEIREAMDMVLGAGTFEQVVSDLYEHFNG